MTEHKTEVFAQIRQNIGMRTTTKQVAVFTIIAATPLFAIIGHLRRGR